ncbi:MAG: outer membrane beta-barrel protein [Agriterribacter sp.]
MKKLLLLALLSAAIAICAHAQDADYKFSVQLQAGPSIPLGRFVHKSFPTIHDTSGNALIGGSVNVQLQYQFAKRFGVSLLLGASINPQDEKYLEKELKKGTAIGSPFGGLPEPNGSEANISSSVDAKSWKVFRIMPGVYYSFPLARGSKFSLKPMLSAGVCKTAVPAYSYKYAYRSSLVGIIGNGYESKQKLPFTFCYQLSLGAHYAISKKVYLIFDAAYFNASSSLKYSYYERMPVSNGGVFTGTSPFYGDAKSGKKRYGLASLNMLAGAGIRF